MIARVQEIHLLPLLLLWSLPWSSLGEAMAPPLKYTMKPVGEAYPAFAKQERPVFNVTRTFPGSAAEDVWRIIADQRRLIGSMRCKIDRMNGTAGNEEMVVTWETPTDWHRWHRTDVRKYIQRSSRTNAFFLVGGFGLWLPRLAFREVVHSSANAPGKASSSILNVGVWYEFDEKYIGWPTDNLKKLTVTRWNKFYDEYSQAIKVLLRAPGGKPVPGKPGPGKQGKPDAKGKKPPPGKPPEGKGPAKPKGKGQGGKPPGKAGAGKPQGKAPGKVAAGKTAAGKAKAKAKAKGKAKGKPGGEL